MLVESIGADGTIVGRAAHQAPEVDGVTTVRSTAPDGMRVEVIDRAGIGAIIAARVTDSSGVDLLAAAVNADGDLG